MILYSDSNWHEHPCQGHYSNSDADDDFALSTIAPKTLFRRCIGFEIEACPDRDLINNGSFGVAWFGVDIARFEIYVDPTRFMSVERGHLLLTDVVVRHFDDGSGEYESKE